MISTTNRISIFYQTLLFVIGVPGNILIILTYCKRKQRTSSGVFIIALALADLGVCLMSPVAIYGYVVYYNYPTDALCKFRFYTNHGLIYVSRFLTIAVAIERYLAVCKPLSKRISPKWAAVISAACFPLGYILTIPIAIAFRLKNLPDGRTMCYPDTSDPAIKWVLKINFPITFLGGLIVVVVCYSLIYRAIKRQMHVRSRMMSGPGPSSASVVSKITDDATTSSSVQKTAQTSFASKSDISDTNPAEQRQPGSSDSATTATTEDINLAVVSPLDTENGKANDGEKRETKNGKGEKTDRKKTSKAKSKSNSMDSTTKMLLIVTVIYFLSFLPQFITLMIPKGAMISFRINHAKGYEVFVFIRRLITVNHIVNPFVYGFINKRFRQDCLATLKGI